MTQEIALFIIVGAIEIFYSPRLQWTSEKRLLLWYGWLKRDYIILI